MDGKGIKIRFEADETPIRSALVRVEKSVKSIAKDLKEVDKLLELDPDNINLLTQKQEQLNTAIVHTTKNLQAMENANGDITKGYQKWQKNQETIEKNAVSIQKMTEELNSAKAAMQAMVSAGGNDIKFTDEYAAAVNNVEALSKAISDLEKEQGKLKMADPEALPIEVYQKYQRDVEALRINLKQLEQQQTEVTSAISAGGLAAQKIAAQEQERMRVEQQAAAAESEKAKAAEEAARAAEEQAKAEEERKAATERAAAADKQAKKASEDYKGALDKLKTAANNVKNDIQGMVTAVATGITAVGGAVAAGTSAVTKTGMEFTKSMSNVQALSGATADELKSLRDAASDAGANTSKTASEAADALGFMALAGWDSKQMLEGLMPVLRASEAGAMDLATCSDLVTDSMSAMGIAVGDLQHYLDVCAKTQSSANTSMEELLEAYVNCGGILNQLNVPLETSATLLGTLANRGIKGSEAGKSLNAILVNLIGANKNAASAMKDMGVSAFDAQGRFIGLDETLRLVKSKLDEYGDDTERITQLEAKLGGKTQLDTLMALLSGVSTEYDSLNVKIQNCNGSLETTAKTMQDNLSGDITSLKSALEGVENTIFSSLEAPFRDAAQNVTKELRDLNAACSEGELADSLKRSAEALSGFISKMAAFAADTAFPTLIKWLEWVANHADAIISAIKGMGAAWATWKIGQYALHLVDLVKAINLVKNAAVAAKASQMGLKLSADAAAVSQETLAAANQMVASSLTLGVAALAALAVALISYARNVDTVHNRLRELNKDIAEHKKNTEESIAANEAEIAVFRDKARRYEELRTEANRTAAQEEKLKELAQELQQYMPEGTQLIDEQTGAYASLADSIDSVSQSMRRKAMLSAYEEEYTELIKEQIEIQKNLDKAQERMKAFSENGGKAVSANVFQNTQFSLLKKDLDDAAQSAIDVQNRLTELDNAIMELHEESAQNPVPEGTFIDASLNGAKIAAEAEGKRIAELNRKNAELVKLGVKQTWEELETSLADLDSELAIKNVSEDDFWAERRKLLEESQYKESADWWKYYDEVTEHYEKLSETERKAQETANKTQQETLKKSIEDQISLVKEKQELDNSYTKEMMYNDMEIIISGLDKESELYKKYNSEILKGRKALADEGAKTIKDGFKEEISEAENSIKSLVSEYQNSLKQLMSDRDTYFNKLFDTSSFTSRSKQKDANGDEADIFSLSDPEEAYKKLVDYEKAVEKLKAKGVSENVMSWIDTLDAATAQDTIDVLNHMTDSSLKTYSDSFDKYKAKAEQMADNKYAPQIDELNKGFIEKVDALIAELPAKAEVDGENTVAGYINGLKSKESDLSAAVTEFTDSIINKIKENLDIHSPSGAAEDLGDYTAKGYIKGLSSEDMSDAVDNFTSSFLTKLAQKDPAIREAMEKTFAGNMAAALGNMESLADVSLNNIASVLSGKIPALPDITKMSLPSYDAVSSAAGSSDLSVIAAKLDKLDTIISLIQSITVLSANGQKIKLELELNGRLTADMNSFVAVIAQKFNNLSIQTSKKVFSY